MKTFEEDKELRMLVKSIKMESPRKDFSALVMNRIFAEKAALEQVKAQPVLGRGFWIILALFIVLMGILAYFTVTGINTGNEENSLVDTTRVAEGYESVTEKISGLPLSIAGILLASSLLLFLDRFLHLKSKTVS